MIFWNLFNFGLVILIVNQVLFTVASKKPKIDDEVDIPSDDDLDFPETSIQDDSYFEDYFMQRGIQRRPQFDTTNPEVIFMDEDANDENENDDDKSESSRKTRFPNRIERPVKFTRKVLNPYYPELQKTTGLKDTRRIGGGLLPNWNKIQKESPEPCLVYPDCNKKI